jgi:uncharacterized protein (TIGR03790 family)
MTDDLTMSLIGRMLFTVILLVSIGGCASEKARTSQKVSADSERVLVVENRKSALSKRIADYYSKKRKILNRLTLDCTTSEEVSETDFETQIFNPLKEHLDDHPEIEFVVLTKDIPIRIGDQGGYSVDAMLVGMYLKVEPIRQKAGQFEPDEVDLDEAVKRVKNPFFRSKTRFSRTKTGMVLVTRLTGYDWKDCKGLIDRSLNAKRNEAPILLDSQPQFGPDDPHYSMEQDLYQASELLPSKGLAVTYDANPTFVGSEQKLGGYVSWGSNDPRFNHSMYRSLRFVPGALAETFVSTSGRTFEPTKGGQSLIADLIRQGATGAKGYVSEPFTFALCRSEVLFDRYHDGFNLAEAFYAASPVIKWKDIVVGDPLCRPFK